MSTVRSNATIAAELREQYIHKAAVDPNEEYLSDPPDDLAQQMRKRADERIARLKRKGLWVDK